MPIYSASSETGLPPSGARGGTLLVVVILAGVILAVYANSLSVPFLFDDRPAIVDNASIRSLGGAWLPPADGSGVTGRPLVNFTLAINYALGGLNPAGYHAGNLLFHLLSALALFGVMRRTLRQPVLRDRYGPVALPLAALGAMLWAVHPLQTESVVCVVQRNEVLAGLFYLLTLYGFIRSVESVGRVSDRPLRPVKDRSYLIWSVLSVGACLLGMASKEIMATAPLLVFLYDRTFVAGSFRAAWRQHGRTHAALAATWVLLAWLVGRSGGSRGVAAGFGLGVTAWQYLLTQSRALTTYLQLTVWPHPLVLDYGTAVVKHPGEVWWQGVVVLVLLVATLWALRRKPVLGFAGAWFFVILAPSSSFIPLVAQTMAEHRMYLPLAAPVMLAVLGLQAWLGRRCLWGGAALALAWAGLTIERNADYQSETAIWADAAAKHPANPRAHYTLAVLAVDAGRWAEAASHARRAVELNPGYVDAYGNLGLALDHLGQHEEAQRYFATALRLNPAHPETNNNLGQVLMEAGRFDEAVQHLHAALRARPEYAEPHNNLGSVLLRQGRFAEAVAQFEEALRRKPAFAEPHNNLGIIFEQQGRFAEAIAQFEEALRLKPAFAEPHNNLGNVLQQTGRVDAAMVHFQQALRLRPDYAEAQFNWGNLCARAGRMSEAAGHYERAVQLKPDYAEALVNLGNALLELNRIAEAAVNYERSLQLQPGLAAARKNLAYALVQLGRRPEAIAQYEALLQLTPADEEARAMLVQLRRPQD